MGHLLSGGDPAAPPGRTARQRRPTAPSDCPVRPPRLQQRLPKPGPTTRRFAPRQVPPATPPPQKPGSRPPDGFPTGPCLNSTPAARPQPPGPAAAPLASPPAASTTVRDRPVAAFPGLPASPEAGGGKKKIIFSTQSVRKFGGFKYKLYICTPEMRNSAVSPRW